jgi:hypothetical protein
MQNMLTNGDDAPPPYEPRDPNGGRPLANGTERVTSPADLHHNLESAIKAARPYNSTSVFQTPDANEIKETPSYCDKRPGHDLVSVSETREGIKLFLSRSHPSPDTFVRANMDAITTFATILTSVAQIFSLSTSSLHIFHDDSGSSIAFNGNGSIFCNLRYFVQLHMPGMQSEEGRVEALAYWWVTMCHELAHNLVSEHSAQHSFYTESFVAQYFRRMVWLAGRFR